MTDDLLKFIDSQIDLLNKQIKHSESISEIDQATGYMNAMSQVQVFILAYERKNR